MKRLFIFAVLLLLASCFPSTDQLQCSRPSPDTVECTAVVAGELIISSSTSFFNYSDTCSPIKDFLDRLSCPAPGVFSFQTDGATSAQIIDGWRPVTMPVKVEAPQN